MEKNNIAYIKEMITEQITGEINIENIARAIVNINPDFIEKNVVDDLYKIQNAAKKVIDVYNKEYESSKSMLEREILSELDTDEQQAGYVEIIHSMFSPASGSSEYISDFSSKTLEEKKQIVCAEIDDISEVIARNVSENINLNITFNTDINDSITDSILINSAAIYYLSKCGDEEVKYPEMIGMTVAGNTIIENEAMNVLSRSNKKEILKKAIFEIIQNLCVTALCCFVGWITIQYGIIGILELFVGGSLGIIEWISILYGVFISSVVLFGCIAIMFEFWSEHHSGIESAINIWMNKKQMSKEIIAYDEDLNDTTEADDHEDKFDNNFGVATPTNI